MIDERHEELASLYALDLLEGAERAQFESALARDPELRRLVQELREAGSTLAHTAPAPAPPAALKSRVLQSIATREKVARPAAAVFRTFLPWAIAACLALVAGWLGQRYATADAEAAVLRQQTAFADTALASLRQQLEAQQLISSRQIAMLQEQMKATDLANLKIAALVSLQGSSQEALAIALWDPAKQEGMFALEKAPALGAGEKLELWVIEDRANAAPVSAGVLSLGRDGRARVRFKPSTSVSAIKMFAVSREKDDGAAFHRAPTTVVMSGAL